MNLILVFKLLNIVVLYQETTSMNLHIKLIKKVHINMCSDLILFSSYNEFLL